MENTKREKLSTRNKREHRRKSYYSTFETLDNGEHYDASTLSKSTTRSNSSLQLTALFESSSTDSMTTLLLDPIPSSTTRYTWIKKKIPFNNHHNRRRKQRYEHSSRQHRYQTETDCSPNTSEEHARRSSSVKRSFNRWINRFVERRSNVSLLKSKKLVSSSSSLSLLSPSTTKRDEKKETKKTSIEKWLSNLPEQMERTNINTDKSNDGTIEKIDNCNDNKRKTEENNDNNNSNSSSSNNENNHGNNEKIEIIGNGIDSVTKTLTPRNNNTNDGELQYLALIRKILEQGEPRADRTGTGTLALFGETLTFDLQNDTLPLLTVKRMELRPIVGELLWFLRGKTDSKDLEQDGIYIWRANSTRENLNELGFQERCEGDLGPIYGFQWRYAGLEYKNSAWDYRTENECLGDNRRGYDQIAYIIKEINENPYSRRIFMSAWNVHDIPMMALPPCHVSFQFYVDNENTLSGLLYMRSADVGLGLPFNIASYAILMHMVARQTNRSAKRLTIVCGDTHVYRNHIEGMRDLLERQPYPAPKLIIKDKRVQDLSEYEIDDFQLRDYRTHSRIKLHMSV